MLELHIYLCARDTHPYVCLVLVLEPVLLVLELHIFLCATHLSMKDRNCKIVFPALGRELIDQIETLDDEL